LISGLVAIVRVLVSMAQRRGWVEAGEANAALKAMKEADNAISRATAARNSVRVAIDRDPASILRDDDGYRRKD
jgi:hypothetical protein